MIGWSNENNNITIEPYNDRMHEWYNDNKDKLTEYKKEYYEENKKKILEKRQEYYEAYKKEINYKSYYCNFIL